MPSAAVAMQKSIDELKELINGQSQTINALNQTIQGLSDELTDVKDTVKKMEGQIAKPKQKKPKADGDTKPKETVKKEKQSDGIEKPAIILPNLYQNGKMIIIPRCCQAIQCNHQMFTQCLEPPTDGEKYCNKCISSELKYGTIDKRDDPNWTDSSGKGKPRKPKPAANFWSSTNISNEDAEKAKDKFLEQFGITDAEFSDYDTTFRERGRPKGSSSAESSPSQKSPPKKRGAPKKAKTAITIVADSDDENDDNPFKITEKPVVKKQHTVKDLFGDDSSDDEDEEQVILEPKVDIVQNDEEIIEPDDINIFNDDDDDDDEDTLDVFNDDEDDIGSDLDDDDNNDD